MPTRILFFIAHHNLFRASQYAAVLIGMPHGSNSTNKIPCQSPNAVHMIFLVNIVCLAAHFYEQGIQNLVSHYNKCLNVGGAYVEK
jgi:hypothetical protein